MKKISLINFDNEKDCVSKTIALYKEKTRKFQSDSCDSGIECEDSAL